MKNINEELFHDSSFKDKGHSSCPQTGNSPFSLLCSHHVLHCSKEQRTFLLSQCLMWHCNRTGRNRHRVYIYQFSHLSHPPYHKTYHVNPALILINPPCTFSCLSFHLILRPFAMVCVHTSKVMYFLLELTESTHCQGTYVLIAHAEHVPAARP